jgi:3-phenylpropionate/trans-cinnamate dioxygenase ferredoxin subunit
MSDPVARVSDIQPGMTTTVAVDGQEVMLCNVDGVIYAIEDICTHDGGALDQGFLEGCEIECPRHGARFDVRTGEAVRLPAVMPVRSYTVRVEGDDIFVEA